MIRPAFTVPIALALCVVALPNPRSAHGAMVDYTTLGNFSIGAALTVGGVAAIATNVTSGTNSATLTVTTSDGLGVVGGPNDRYIDANEIVTFRFIAGPATGVSFSSNGFTQANGSPRESLEGLGSLGQSLGVVTFFASDAFAGIDVSSRFGGVALSGFRILGNGSATGFGVAQVIFTSTAVPEPTSVAMLGTGLAVALIARRRRTITT